MTLLDIFKNNKEVKEYFKDDDKELYKQEIVKGSDVYRYLVDYLSDFKLADFIKEYDLESYLDDFFLNSLLMFVITGEQVLESFLNGRRNVLDYDFDDFDLDGWENYKIECKEVLF